MQTRKLFVQALGYGIRNVPEKILKKEMHMCTHHPFEKQVSKQVQFVQKGVTYKHTFTIKKFPVAVGKKGRDREGETVSKGGGKDQFIANYFKKGKQESESNLHQKNQMDWAMMYQAEVSTPCKDTKKFISPEVAKQANIHLTPFGVHRDPDADLIHLKDEKTRKRRSIYSSDDIASLRG